jgi:acyl-CoA reductase-like NAD-dependent aldehyde dehydrogenase
MTSLRFPPPPPTIAPTPLADVDAAVERLASKKQAWVNTPLPDRVTLLRQCLTGVASVAPDWVRDICAVKGIHPNDTLAGEEWLAGPVTTARNVRLLIEALEANGQPKLPNVTQRPNGQYVVRVTPAGLHEKVMFAGLTIDVWVEPGKPASQGRIYREPKGSGKVSLVLGAGNVSSIPATDVLYKLCTEDEVVVLKMNPVNAAAGPHLARAFRVLIDAGFLAIVYGGAEVGAHLANHAKIDTLHVTGSDRTYDAIVWGADTAEQARRKAAGTPLNTRPFTAELGCVTPCMVVPGSWTDADLDFQARNVAGMVTQNASFNCNAAKVLITAKGWPQRAKFLEKVRATLARAPARKAYYPGAEARFRRFLDEYPQAQQLGAAGDGIVPWTVIPNVPAVRGEYALTNEAFCGVLAEVELEATTASEFLDKVVDFANESCWGTLSCVVLIDDFTARSQSHALDRAIEQLRYGAVCINAWAGLLYGLASPTWGAFPGHPTTDIQSGSGVVHNTYLLDHPQKSVMLAPFRMKPTPVWFFDHENLKNLGENLLRLETSASLGNFARTALAGLKG